MNAAVNLHHVTGGFLGGVGRLFQKALDAGREKREAKAWVKALPKGYLDGLLAKIALPDWMFDESQHVCVCARTEKEAPVVMRKYLDQHFSELTELRKEVLAYELYVRRWQKWSDATKGVRTAEFWAQYHADEAAKAAAFDARRAAQRAQPDPLSPEGMRAQVENSLANSGSGRLASGRVVGHDERVRLGLPGGARRIGGTGLLDAMG